MPLPFLEDLYTPFILYIIHLNFLSACENHNSGHFWQQGEHFVAWAAVFLSHSLGCFRTPNLNGDARHCD